MSRYSFEYLIDTKPVNYFDINGNSYKDWCDYGILGYDEQMETYFLQLDLDDHLIWWFGRTESEIRSPYQLLAIIARLFDESDYVAFNKQLINTLINDRNNAVDKIYEPDFIASILGHYKIQDDYWGKHCKAFKIDEDEDASIFPTPSSLREDYIENAYKPYGDIE